MIGSLVRSCRWTGFQVLVLPLLTGVLYGQNNVAIKAAEAACGTANARFHVVLAPEIAKLPPRTGKAVIYVLEMPSGPTVRVGMDGKWIGAEKGASHLAVRVSPGVHHLCVQQQSRSKFVNELVALNSLEAKADHTYYFLVDVARPLGPAWFRLDALNEDEGKELSARWPAAVAQALPPAKK